ncbi:hypothetical protein [Nocardia jejuensis]|uniref:hypothetical protein n=1 Tax=Nocardia jejuensis TaxID=328049 RepID=UPI0012F90B18|nr:hypothetical protein [Nocardia jejuensis]
MTVREVADRIVELGLVDTAAVSALDPRDLDYALDDFGATECLGVLLLLDDLKVRYSTDYKTFRHACEDNAWAYRTELARVAACGRGAFTFTEVELINTAEGNHLLRFRCNGQSHNWPIMHGPTENTDAQTIFCWALGELMPRDSPARWCTVTPADPYVTSEAYFGDPATLNELGGPFDLRFEPIMASPSIACHEPDSAETEHLHNWLHTQQARFPDWIATYGHQIAWDHSPESVEALGAIVLRRIPTLDDVTDPANAEFIDSASWYIGETLRLIKGGRWAYRDGDPEKFLYDGLPFVEQYGDSAHRVVPHRALRVLIKRADPHYLRQRYDAFATQ